MSFHRSFMTLVVCLAINAASTGFAQQPDTPSPSAKDRVVEVGRTVIEDAKAMVTAPLRMESRDYWMAGGALAAVGGAFALDHSVNRLVERNQRSSGRDVADGFNTLGSPGVLVALNAGMIAVGYARESSDAPGGAKLKQTGLVSLEAELFAVAATLALKEITGRARPDEQKGTAHFRPFSGGASFASNHAAASFAVASVLADRYEYGWLAYAPAAAVAVSRVYSREHFTSDVVAGSLIGWGMGTFLSRRHRLESDWHVQPAMTLDGSGMGLALRKQF